MGTIFSDKYRNYVHIHLTNKKMYSMCIPCMPCSMTQHEQGGRRQDFIEVPECVLKRLALERAGDEAVGGKRKQMMLWSTDYIKFLLKSGSKRIQHDVEMVEACTCVLLPPSASSPARSNASLLKTVKCIVHAQATRHKFCIYRTILCE